MKRKVILLTEIISPYRIPVFNEMARSPEEQLLVLFFAESEKRRFWKVEKEKIKFTYRVLPGIRFQKEGGSPYFFNPTIFFNLLQYSPRVIIIGGYHHPSSLLALFYARIFRRRAILWCESSKNEQRSDNAFKRTYKKWFVSNCDGYVVPGKASGEYLLSLGAKKKKIWFAPNAVDNDFFGQACQDYKLRRKAFKQSKGYPGKIILYVGRLIDQKGILDLFEAFRILCERDNDVGLLLVGSGRQEEDYKNFCSTNNIKNVFFEGFRHQEELPAYYAAADCLVLPTHSDPWGLVLNEAMACGLPVISTEAAGAASDLIINGENGYIFKKGNIQQLAVYLADILSDEQKRIRMGERSSDIIKGYSPLKCAQGFIQAIQDSGLILNLKAAVKQYWEDEICGTRYGTSEDKIKQSREIAQARYEMEPHIPDFAGFKTYGEKPILEIGLGAGTDFLNWVKNQARAVGIDLSEASVNLTRQRIDLEGINPARVGLCVADAENLPFKDNTFELVYTWGVLHHTPDTQRALREISRVLIPSGTIKAMIYHVPSWTGWMLWFRFCLLRLRPWLSAREAIFRYLESPGTKAYTLNEADRLFANAGFQEINIRTLLGPGDLLLIRPNIRYQSFIYRIVWLIYPRWLVRFLGNRFGLELLVQARK